MTERTDFSLPDGDDEKPQESPTGHPPVIVIEYRHRGLAARLMPPALILFAGLAVSSYQRKTPVWPLIPRPTQVASVSPTELPTHGEESRRVEPETTKVSGGESGADRSTDAAAVASPHGTQVVAPPEQTRAERPSSPFELEAGDGLVPLENPPAVASADAAPAPEGTSPAGATTGLAPSLVDPIPEALLPPHGENPNTQPPQNAADPSRDEILRDIEREAEQKDAQRQNLEGLKSNAKSLILNEALSRVYAERVPFLDELKNLLAQMGDDAGEEIEKLSNRYGKDPIPQVKSAYARLLRTAPKRMSRQAKVEMMRGVGVPEPLILDQICHDFDKMVNTRGGPRSEDQVRVRAARALLSIPLTPTTRKASSRPIETREPRRPAANAAVRPDPGSGTRP